MNLDFDGGAVLEDLIIFGTLAVIIVAAVLSVVRRSGSKASCCGSGGYTAKSRKLRSVTEKKTFRVEGMSCHHCVNRVMEAVQDIPHTSASVSLKKGTVTVSMEQPVAESEIIAAIEKAGYPVKGRA